MLSKIRRRLITGDFALTELFHHLSMFNALGSLQLEPVLLQKIDGHIKRSAFVPVDKGMVAGNRLGIAGGELKRVCFAVGMLVLWPSKGGLKQSGVPQALCAACHLDHSIMDELDLLARHLFRFRHLFASSMMVLR